MQIQPLPAPNNTEQSQTTKSYKIDQKSMDMMTSAAQSSLSGGASATYMSPIMKTLGYVGGVLINCIVGFVLAIYGVKSFIGIVNIIVKSMNPNDSSSTLKSLVESGGGSSSSFGFDSGGTKIALFTSPLGGFVTSMVILTLIFSGAGSALVGIGANIVGVSFNILADMAGTISATLSGVPLP